LVNFLKGFLFGHKYVHAIKLLLDMEAFQRCFIT